MALIVKAKVSQVMDDPRLLLEMCPTTFFQLIRGLKRLNPTDRMQMQRYLVDMYHFWSRHDNLIAELLTRLVYELFIGKLEIRDLITQKWRWTGARDNGHMFWILKLVKAIRSDSKAMFHIKKCRWLNV
jgi:hypothetical protein